MIKPFENYVVLEEKPVSELGITETGIILQENANIERPNIGKIVVCGPDVVKVKEGDEVLFQYHLFEELTWEKKKYMIGKDTGIVALC